MSKKIKSAVADDQGQPPQTARQKRNAVFEELHNWSFDVGVDHKSLILRLKSIAIECMEDGVTSEKICAGVGILEVRERFPAIAIQAIQGIHRILGDCQKELDSAPIPDPIINLIVSRRRLEDALDEEQEYYQADDDY